ncbi:MAG: hypothetical protein M3P06_14170 [Acidobacteriota bacterium]|nr:hypothetical protein [Acidobacteriota bacterium]
MRLTLRFFRSTASRFRQRGSAMLASLMVIVGLSLLGLAFVAMSETESAISINQRNHSQTVAVAEAGARLVVQWFQNPNRMETLELMPENENTIKTSRVVGTYSGYYKPDVSAMLLCDIPFGPAEQDKFYGEEDSADIRIDRTNAVAFLDEFNDRFLGEEGTTDARPGGEITEIRIFAPPIVGATLVGGFYDGGTRYGVATIMVRAERFDRPRSAGTRRSVARAEVRIVISQFPVPTPAGPLQSASALATNGNFNVNWGLVSGQQTLDLKKDYTALPWFNAFEKIHFNRGYDSSVQWTATTAYRIGDVVRPSPAAIIANPLIRYLEYAVTTNGTTSATEPTWPDTLGGTITDGTVVVVTRTPTAYPLSLGGANNQTNIPWLYYIARGNITIDDPWFHARSAMDIDGEPNNNAQPYAFPYANPATYGKTHHFQFQNFDQYPNFKQLLFPIISYDYWKSAAIAGNNDGTNSDGIVKYLRWVAGDTYTDGLTTKTMRAWAGSEMGFFFFDTQNAQNPQNGGPGILAPDVTINGGGAYMGSFVYLNANFATTGLSGPVGNFNQPGEPYMDIGFREVDETAGPDMGDFKRDASGMPIVKNAVNGQWDYQDLEWSNTGAIAAGTDNGTFDVYVASRTVHDPSVANPATTYAGWFPVPYRVGCLPGNNSCGTCNCSEPHEPYLNIKYTAATLGIQPGWFDPATAVGTMRRPKITTDGERTGTPWTCTAASTVAQCTSNSYDLDGGLVSMEPATDGVLYVEGDFTSKGNAAYYGSVLVGGEVDAKGTPQLWYDESLSRGIKRTGFPRVLVTSIETDR